MSLTGHTADDRHRHGRWHDASWGDVGGEQNVTELALPLDLQVADRPLADRLAAALALARLGRDLDVSVGPVNADPLPIPDQPGGMLHPHDRRQAVLPCDDRAMSH